MSSRFPGGLNKPNIYPAITGAGTTRWTGVWTLTDAANALVAGNWPSAPIWSWGYNGSGRLGLGNTTTFSSPQQVGNTMIPWTDISHNTDNGFAVRKNGTLWSWGNNYAGALGLGNTTNYSSPKQVGALTTWYSVHAGNSFCHAIKTDGTLWGWGYNTNGQLGDGTAVNKSSPVQIGAATNWSKITSIAFRVVGLKTDGTIWSWGQAGPQLGQPGASSYSSPTQIGALTTWTDVAFCGSTPGSHVKALKSGQLWTWGNGNNGQLGLGNTTTYSSPMQVGTLTTWTALGTFGGIYSGQLWHWGYNVNRCLGIAATNYISSPVQVGAGTDWLSLSVGSFVRGGTGIKTNGTLWGWGYNGSGALGTGNTTNSPAPLQIGLLTTWIKTTNGASGSTIALKTV